MEQEYILARKTQLNYYKDVPPYLKVKGKKFMAQELGAGQYIKKPYALEKIGIAVGMN